MALIEVYLYPYDRKTVSSISLIKLHRHYNGIGLADSKVVLDLVAYDSRNTDFYMSNHRKTHRDDVVFYSGSDVKLGLYLSNQLKLMGCNTEILYNGNMKTLDLLYGR